MLDLSILILEDDDDQRSAFSAMLRPLGYWVDVVADGIDAVIRHRERLERRRPFDLFIFSLIVNHGIGGASALAQIRDFDRHTRAIATAGDAQILVGSRRAGFAASLVKPCVAQALYETIAAVDVTPRSVRARA